MMAFKPTRALKELLLRGLNKYAAPEPDLKRDLFCDNIQFTFGYGETTVKICRGNTEMAEQSVAAINRGDELTITGLKIYYEIGFD